VVFAQAAPRGDGNRSSRNDERRSARRQGKDLSPVKHVTCPQCGARVEWTPASRFRPFCSERCKLIDLGAWASESYRIPLAEPEETELDAGADPDAQATGKRER